MNLLKSELIIMKTRITFVDASDDCTLGKDMVQSGARPQHVSTKLYNEVSFLRKIHMYMQ